MSEHDPDLATITVFGAICFVAGALTAALTEIIHNILIIWRG